VDSSLQIHNYLSIAWRRRWVLLIPAALGLAAAAVVLPKLPTTYMAAATVAEDKESGQTLSQKRRGEWGSALLDRLKRDEYAVPVARRVFELPDDAEVGAVKIGRVSKPLDLEVTGELVTFTVTGADPEFVAKVANAYTEEFVERTRQAKLDRSGQYKNFYEKELDEKKTSLDEKEKEIAAFRDAHRGALPEEIDVHTQIIQRMNEDLIRAKLDLQARIDERDVFVANLNITPQGSMSNPGSGGGADPAKRAADLEQELATMRLRMTPEHPDYKAKARELEVLREQMAKPHEAPPESETLRPTAAELTPARIGTVNYNQLMSMDREIRRLSALVSDTQNEIARHQAAVRAANLSSVAWASLVRDREAITAVYNTLRANYERANLNQELNTDLTADSFHILESATVPRRPIGPHTLRVLALGLAAGLGLGFGFVVLLEFFDQTYDSPEELTRDFSVPILAVITRIEKPSAKEERELQRRRRAG